MTILSDGKDQGTEVILYLPIKRGKRRMYKIMLADDEGIVIDSLKFIIEKNSRIPVRCSMPRPAEV